MPSTPPHRSLPSRTVLLTLLRSYLPDYLLTLLLLFLFGYLTHRAGFQQQFSINDPSIQHSYTQHDRVPMYATVLLAAVFPLLSFLLISLIYSRSLYDLHSATLGLLLTLSLTTVLTNICKLTVGRPRPDLLARCLLPPGTVDSGPPGYGLVSPSLCTQPNAHILADGFKSFFSGHSSFSFAGLGFLSLYLAGKLALFDQRGYAFKPWLVGAPLVAAALVAISRVMDYRHHWQDVVVGSAVGWGMSWFVYRLYYPPLTSPNASKPYAPRHSLSEPQTQSQIQPLLPLHVQSSTTAEEEEEVPEGTIPRPGPGPGGREWQGATPGQTPGGTRYSDNTLVHEGANWGERDGR
ncbi:acid phosphatase/Vanadium-dependent haloperoxidase [Calocera viscosa TUFC12733]|uniref:Acid phosphatase/Vanadium-dependent haloperoxidase n=1 Tax=Calocera viscosa (strain TUFC12733) TaxID=1330018 RepID=A0A167QEQ5_CALVF|nr:acid phosphatase/Vanadium-dependent haloperoxidase [Calocera viscosa TUFC12733]